MPGSFDRALLLYQQSRYDLAEQELRRTLAADPDFAPAHALLAFCLTAKQDLVEATREARQAVAKAPGLSLGHYAMAHVLLHQERIAEAQDAITEAIRLDPHDADYFAFLANIRLQQKRAQEALTIAEQGLAVDPDHVGCLNLRGMALVRLGRKQEAGAALEGALAKNPENALTHANQGWTLLHRGDHRKALEHFREALRIDPELDWARVGIVEALKARHLLYRWMLAYFLWMSRASGKAQWALILGVFFGPRILGDIARSNPGIAPVLWPLAIGLLVFAYLTWVADPLFNLLLRVNKFGRYALSRDQVVASNWVGLCVLGALAAPPVLWATRGAGIAQLSLAYFLLLVLPVAVTFRCPRGWPRVLMGLYTLGMAGLGLRCLLGIVLLDSALPEHQAQADWHARLGQLFVLGVVVSTWVGAGLSRAK